MTLRFFVLLIAILYSSELPALQQDKRVACGPRVVSIAKRIIDGREIDPTELERAFHGALVGSHSLGDLAEAAKAMGLNAKFVDLNSRNPGLSREPTVVPITRDGIPSSHFVVVFGRDEHVVQVIDYPRPPVFVELSEFAEMWNGEAIVISAATSRFNAWVSDFPNLFQLVLICVSGHVALVCLSYFVFTFLRKSGTAKARGSVT
jgi:ABC-type bacteriocin/lantibiotic exporter with double-glycine peptidase domain